MINDLEIVQWDYLLDPAFQLVNTAGKPLTNGWIEVYIHGTRDKYYCASDFNGTLHPFQIPLDSLGSNIVLASPANAYDVYVYNVYGSLVMSRYNVKPGSGSGSGVIPADASYGIFGTNELPFNNTTNTGFQFTAKDIGGDDITFHEITYPYGRIDCKEGVYFYSATIEVSNTSTSNESVKFQVLAGKNPNQSIYWLDFDNSYLHKQLYTICGIANFVNDDTFRINVSPYQLTNGVKATASQVAIHKLSTVVEGEGGGGGHEYGAGWGILINNDEIAVDPSIIPTIEYVDASVSAVSSTLISTIETVSGNLQEQIDNIPAQVQSDWNQTDDTQVDYIKNKPDLSHFVTDDVLVDAVTSVSAVLETDIQVVSGALDDLTAVVASASGIEYGQFYSTGITTTPATMARVKGTITVDNGRIQLKKGSSYHVTVRGRYNQTTAANTNTAVGYIEYVSNNTINVNVDKTITDSQYFEISYDLYNLSNNVDYLVWFTGTDGGTINDLWIEVHSLTGIGGQGGGTEYTAGDGIDITSDTISVDAGKGLGFDADHKLEVKVGDGLTIDDDNNVITIDTEVGDVVNTVEKLKTDLDTQLTVNFDMPNVDNVYDFADTSVIGNLSNGAVMLCQAFTVPINHDIRVDDGETENPTLIGIYAKQAFTGKKIMLALYVYDFDTGYTDYVGDTGPVEVTQGRNEFPLVHINSNITELKSSCVYYASLYLPSNAHSNGLYLAGCPSYSNASYINATPRFTVGVQNIINPNTNQEIDMSNATTGRLDFNDGNGNYYIGPWSDNYNERPSIPRFFMQIRNGEVEEPIVVEPFTDIGSYTLKNTSSLTDVFGSTVTVNTSTYGAMFMEVTPAQDVDVTGWVCYDNYATDERNWYGTVFDSAFENKLSEASNGTISELGEISTGSGIYGHEFTRSTALHLTANTTYRFLVGIPHSNNDMLVQYNTPSVPKNLHLFESGYNVSQWVTYSRANNVQGIDFLIKDANHEWRV